MSRPPKNCDACTSSQHERCSDRSNPIAMPSNSMLGAGSTATYCCCRRAQHPEDFEIATYRPEQEVRIREGYAREGTFWTILRAAGYRFIGTTMNADWTYVLSSAQGLTTVAYQHELERVNH